MTAPVILIKERHIVEAMQRLAITHPAGALSVEQLADLGVDDRGLAWVALKRRGVVCEAAPGLWYVDSEAWHTTRSSRQRVLIIVLAVVVLAAAVVFLSATRISQ